ncbi:MAG: hypothetical protein P9X27_01505 [Candidatus Kaelpia aquatica]|nr:hypothetical protein [Candidatus Kaelpia aquatica]
MRKVYTGLILVLVLVLAWALLERKERVEIARQFHKLESSYHAVVTNSTYLEDKIQSFQEKLDNVVIRKDELFEVNKSKEEYIDSLEIKLNKAIESINKLRGKLGKLEELLAGIQGPTVSDVQR